jgi:hypothetical protein
MPRRDSGSSTSEANWHGQSQIVTATWDTFVATYAKTHRPAMGPLRANCRRWRVPRQSVHGVSRPVNPKATGLPFLRLRCPD